MSGDISRRTVLRGIGVGAALASVGTGIVSGHRGGIKGELAEVRSATAMYNDPENAVDDGYIPTDDAVCNMGYHYANPGLFGSTDRTTPQVLVYGEDDDGNRMLGAVEYLVPKAGQYVDSPPDLFVHDGGEEHWDTLAAPFGTFWALHVWVHTHNPEGVFNHTNPRKQFSPEGCH